MQQKRAEEEKIAKTKKLLEIMQNDDDLEGQRKEYLKKLEESVSQEDEESKEEEEVKVFENPKLVTTVTISHPNFDEDRLKEDEKEKKGDAKGDNIKKKREKKMKHPQSKKRALKKGGAKFANKKTKTNK